MNLENYACGGVPGRVSSWILQKENVLTDILEEGVGQYIAKNTDPYVLDAAPLKFAICLRIPNSVHDKSQYKELVLSNDYPAVPCVQNLENATIFDSKGQICKIFPLSLFEERFKTCADLITRLALCETDYILANQKIKKAIFQTLFSEDDADLTEILEDET